MDGCSVFPNHLRQVFKVAELLIDAFKVHLSSFRRKFNGRQVDG
jgi:hypothetical protein